MLDSSTLYKQEIRENTKVRAIATIVYADGDSEDITGERFLANSISFDDSVSASGSLQVGSAIVNTFNCTLNNYDGHFDDRDFTDAQITVTICKDLSNDTTEEIIKGTYIVEQPETYGSTISINANDKMILFARPFSEIPVTYPITCLELVQDICTYCGVSLLSYNFTNNNLELDKPEDTNSMTCLDVISYISQIAGCYARITNLGYLQIKWYGFEDTNIEDALNGGSFNTNTTPYSDGDDADGGNFDYDDTEDSFDGGSFTDLAPYQIYSFNNIQICTDDVLVTGIRLVDDEDNEIVIGDTDYVLSIEDNPFINVNNALSICESLATKLVGMRFRPFSASALSDATVEAGDSVIVYYNNQNYASIITHCNFKAGNYETFECSAETPMRNKAKSYSASTKTLIKARREMKKQLNDYDIAVQQLTSLITQSYGIFKSQEVQLDGSVIYYMHNKPTLEDSSTIWKMTGNTMSVSTDGGETWNAGIDSEGNAVVNVLSAVGINFDWARGGSLHLGGQNNTNGEIKIFNSEGVQCGQLNNSGLAIFSPTSQVQVLITPDIGLVVRDADGNEYYGYTVRESIDMPAYGTIMALGYRSYNSISINTHTVFHQKVIAKQKAFLGYKYKFQYWYTMQPEYELTPNTFKYTGISTYTLQLPNTFKGKNISVQIVCRGISQDKLSESIYNKEYRSYTGLASEGKAQTKADGSVWTDTEYGEDIFFVDEYNVGQEFTIDYGVYGQGNMYDTASNYQGTEQQVLPPPESPSYLADLSASQIGNYVEENTTITYTVDKVNATVTVTVNSISSTGFSINDLLDIQVIATC